MAIETHIISDALAKQIANGNADEVIMDAETLQTISFGCFICEQPLTPDVIARHCPGDPS